MRSIYLPDNTQSAQQYGVIPMQRVEIMLNGMDRSNGEQFPQLEGDGFYILACDYPFLMSVVDRFTNRESTIYCIPGVRFSGSFKGATITHPLITASNGGARAAFALLKGKETNFDNQLSNPFPSFYPPVNVITDTGILGTVDIYVPPNTRFIQSVQVTFLATTVTSPLTLSQMNGSAALGGQTVPGFGQTSGTTVRTLAPVSAGFAIAEFTGIPIVRDCTALRLVAVGTGMSFSAANLTVKALFQ
jgi:hypothetical protein